MFEFGKCKEKSFLQAYLPISACCFCVNFPQLSHFSESQPTICHDAFTQQILFRTRHKLLGYKIIEKQETTEHLIVCQKNKLINLEDALTTDRPKVEAITEFLSDGLATTNICASKIHLLLEEGELNFY